MLIQSTMDVLYMMHRQNMGFDYTAFTRECAANNVPQIDQKSFASFMGMVATAASMYPGEELPIAYEKLLVLGDEQASITITTPTNVTTTCGSCGGGAVR